MDCLQKAVLRGTFRGPQRAHHLERGCASTLFVSQWDCVRAHTPVGGSGLRLRQRAEGGTRMLSFSSPTHSEMVTGTTSTAEAHPEDRSGGQWRESNVARQLSSAKRSDTLQGGTDF